MLISKLTPENDSPPNLKPWALLPIAIVITSGLIACEKKPVKDSAENESSVLAVIGRDHITTTDLDAELATLKEGEISGQQSKARQQALEALIDRDILKQEAIREKMDLDPAVQQTLERERGKILAQTYLQAKSLHAEKPTQAEIDAYYRDHSSTYANRKLVSIEQIALESKEPQTRVKEMADGGKSLEQIAAWLDKRKIIYTRARSEVTSDTLSPEIADRVDKLGNGSPFIVSDDGRFQLCSMKILHDSPATKDQVAKQIEHILKSQDAHKAMIAEIAQLRSVAKVEYRTEPDDWSDIRRLTAVPTPLLPTEKSDVRTNTKEVKNVATPIN